jgi:hypothetical protein
VVEQLAFNQLVVGSIPTGLTKKAVVGCQFSVVSSSFSVATRRVRARKRRECEAREGRPTQAYKLVRRGGRPSATKQSRRLRARTSPSSRGLGHRPFTAATRVRIPLGTPILLRSSRAEIRTYCRDRTRRRRSFPRSLSCASGLLHRRRIGGGGAASDHGCHSATYREPPGEG